jgi:neutral ceramidase
MAYIPSRRILIEDVPPRASSRWGYEGNTSMAVYGMPANRWADDVEDRVGFAVRRLMEKVGK